MRDEALGEIARDLQGHLDWLRDCGVRELPAAPRLATPPTPARHLPQEVAPSAVVRPMPPAPPSPPPAPQAAPRPATGPSLPQIRAELGECRRCALHAGRTHIVFGVGNPKAELCIVGEGPGADEDATGEPFVGAAGKLLDQMIVAMGLTRAATYICNIVKCRPPGNRTPAPEEIATCLPFLRAQILSVQPRVVVALGAVAAQTLLGDKTAIGRLRGRWHEYDGIPLMPTFHPAYLLRSPGEKKKVWEDLKAVVQALGRTLPAK